MLFCTQKFLLFFLVVFAVYWAMPWRNFRVYLLLIASFYFYASWNKWLAILIVVSTTIDYFIALRLDSDSRPRVRKLLVTTSIAFNLGVLCYFKYANFFLSSLGDALKAAGASTSLPVLSVILPIGISFYTFEAISYVVDVYRRKIRAETNLAHFMLFILFFPHLIAGPIVRGSDFLPQVRRKKRWNWMRMNVGIQLFVLGMVKKLMIGDRLALLVDPVYANPGSYDGGVLWLTAIAYAVQVYCDFSGYTDMALGTAHLLGYRLAFNFNLPFLAPNIAEFWRRWHLTLSNWLRDYVYIPLGGSRFSGWCTYRNLFITMTLCGLWHGASWNFVLFGVVQAVCLSVYRMFRKWVKVYPDFCWALESSIGTALSVTLTFLTFCVTLVIFRASSLTTSWTMLQRMFTPSPGSGPPLAYTHVAVALTLFVLGLIAARNGMWKRVVDRMPTSVNGFAQAAMITIVLLTASHSGKVFIYFQF